MDSDHDTPLICAANGLHLEICDLLLANNADVNAKNLQGYTALYVAASKGDEALPIIKLLLKSDANSTLGPTHGNDDAGATPLFIAADRGSNAIIECLLKNGASVNINSDSGWTMMHAAAARGNKKSVRLFHDAGVPFDTPQNGGLTPLHMASIAGNLITAKALLDLGASVDSLDKNGATPLMHSVANERGTLVKLLLSRGANHTLGMNGLTLLHYAAMGGLDDIVMMLIRAGAPVDVKSDDTHTPTEFAIGKGHKNTVGILNAELHKQKVAANLAKNGRYVTVWVTSDMLHT